MIRTSKHSVKFLNKQKDANLAYFLSEYRRIAKLIVNDLWNNGYNWEYKNEQLRFSVQENLLQFPSFLDYKKFNIESTLSARAMSSLVTQLVAVMKAATEKQRKRLFQLEKMKHDGVSKSNRKLLIKKIKQNIPQIPNVSKLNPELSSKCADFLKSDGLFRGFLRLKSILHTKEQIKIPLKWHRHALSLEGKGKMMNSFLITDTEIQIRWKIKPEITENGNVIGADQGIKDILTCSDFQSTPSECPHGHSLESVMLKLSRKKKGSVGFRKAQEHRKNIINWSINQLNLNGVKELRLEKIWNIGFRQNSGNFMSHWTNTIIRDKVSSVCEQNGVRFVEQYSTYRSQRCSSCGIVRKSNRKGKIYSCTHCGFKSDADLNASLNHVSDLPEIPWNFRGKKFNLGNGFYWLESGFYEFLDGSTESPSNKKKLNVTFDN